MPEDRAVVGVGQLEVLGHSRRGEADHLIIYCLLGQGISTEEASVGTVSGKMMLEGNGLDDA